MNYSTGSIILYRTYDGSDRLVRVTGRHSDVKNGKAGFDGVTDSGQTVWGYDYQIRKVFPAGYPFYSPALVLP